MRDQEQDDTCLEMQENRGFSRYAAQISVIGVTYGSRSATGVDLGYILQRKPVLTSAIFPERYAAVLLREVRRLERVLVLEFSMRHLAVTR